MGLMSSYIKEFESKLFQLIDTNGKLSNKMSIFDSD